MGHKELNHAPFQNEERDNSIISQSFKSTCLKILSALFAGVRFGYLSEPVPFETEKTDANKDKPEWKDDVDVEDLLDALDTSLSLTDNACWYAIPIEYLQLLDLAFCGHSNDTDRATPITQHHWSR